MTDEKKVQPMTLDDLIDGLDNLRIEGVNSAYDYVDYVRDNRTALEAGMRGTLRFRIVKMGDELTDAIWYQTHMLGSDPRMTVLIFGNVPTRQMAKIFAATLANNISLTAEFVKEESE